MSDEYMCFEVFVLSSTFAFDFVVIKRIGGVYRVNFKNHHSYFDLAH
jgi:hypothetical protein